MAAAAGAVVAPTPGDGQPEKRRSPYDLGHPRRRATDVFLCINAALYVLNWLSQDILMLWGCKVNSLIAAGQVWRLFTAQFLHPKIIHLLVNMHALHTLGPQVELMAGSSRTALIYLASGVFGTFASFMLCPSPSLGASGAVFGLGAALAVFYMSHRELLGPVSENGLRGLMLTGAINVAFSMAYKKIDNWGHFGGFVAGAALSFLLGPRFVEKVSEGKRSLQDLPPLPWMAFSGPRALGVSLPARRRAAAPPPPGAISGGGSSSGSGSLGVGDGGSSSSSPGEPGRRGSSTGRAEGRRPEGEGGAAQPAGEGV